MEDLIPLCFQYLSLFYWNDFLDQKKTRRGRESNIRKEKKSWFKKARSDNNTCDEQRAHKM